MELSKDYIVLVVGVISWAITIGIFKNKVEVLEERMRSLEESNTATREAVGELKKDKEYLKERMIEMQRISDDIREMVANINMQLAVITAAIKHGRQH